MTTQKWKLVPVEPDDSTLSAMHEKMYDVRGMKWHDGMAAVYMAGVNAAPPPQMLSDERILEIAMSDDVSLIEDQGPGVRPRITVHNSIGGVYAFARAIEREILGGGE